MDAKNQMKIICSDSMDHICKAYKLQISISLKIVSEDLFLSHNMRFPTMWYMRPAKATTSLRIRSV